MGWKVTTIEFRIKPNPCGGFIGKGSDASTEAAAFGRTEEEVRANIPLAVEQLQRWGNWPRQAQVVVK